MQELMNALSYQFKDPGLLRQALTHPSMGKNDNQRLEFLGDAVLQYIMSDMLYASHPESQEGSLTHLRALLVCEAALSQVARGLHVGEALIMDKGEEMTGGRDKPSVLCDAMEAVLAAVYLDGGMEAARQLVLRHWPRPEDVVLTINAVTAFAGALLGISTAQYNKDNPVDVPVATLTTLDGEDDGNA